MYCATHSVPGESGPTSLSVSLQIHTLCHNLPEWCSHAPSNMPTIHGLSLSLCSLFHSAASCVYRQAHSDTNTHTHTHTVHQKAWQKTGNFLSKLVIVALSHQEWKSMPLAERTCCSVEQWNDSGEWVALGPALKGPVNRISSERDTAQGQGFPCHQGVNVNWGDKPAGELPLLPISARFFFPPSQCPDCEQPCSLPQRLVNVNVVYLISAAYEVPTWPDRNNFSQGAANGK